MSRSWRKTPLARLGDRLLGLMVAMALGVGWFVALWGLRLTALTAGMALGGLLMLLGRCFTRASVRKREKQMRRELGGELALDALLLMPDRKAAFQAAIWLMPRAKLTLSRMTDAGVLCARGDERVLITLIACHPSETIGVGALVKARKEALALGAERVLLCLTAEPTREARAWAETGEPPIRILSRAELIDAAGACAPATDEQLSALKPRARRLRARDVAGHVLAPGRARRYFWYGLGMAALYFVTGLSYYPLPAALCLLLSLGCKLYRTKVERGAL